MMIIQIHCKKLCSYKVSILRNFCWGNACIAYTLMYCVNTTGVHFAKLYTLNLIRSIHQDVPCNRSFSPPNKLLSSIFLSALNLKKHQCCSKFVKTSECLTAWIWMRRRVTRRLIRIQAFCIWHYSRVLKAG